MSNTSLNKARQIPSSKKYCANQDYLDILYAYLQYRSHRDWDDNKIEKGPRYLLKSEINFSALGEALDLSRQTVSTKFKKLVELGLIEFSEEKKTYYLTMLSANDATLIPYDLLEFMVDTFSKRAYSVYCYLFNRFWANNKQPYEFTYDQIKNHLGICDKTRSNDTTIANILTMLVNNSLISYELVTKTGLDNGNIKTVYKITKVSNQKPENAANRKKKKSQNVKKLDAVC